MDVRSEGSDCLLGHVRSVQGLKRGPGGAGAQQPWAASLLISEATNVGIVQAWTLWLFIFRLFWVSAIKFPLIASDSTKLWARACLFSRSWGGELSYCFLLVLITFHFVSYFYRANMPTSEWQIDCCLSLTRWSQEEPPNNNNTEYISPAESLFLKLICEISLSQAINISGMYSVSLSSFCQITLWHCSSSGTFSCHLVFVLNAPTASWRTQRQQH